MSIQHGTHIIHTVQHGDTVYSLSVRYQSDINEITRANSLYPPFTELYGIYPGQVLVIPKIFSDRNQTFYVIQPQDTIGSISQSFSTYSELLVGINQTIHNPNFIFPNQQIQVPVFIYQVEIGDSIWTIAERTGVSINELLQANVNRPSISQDLIFEGVTLIIPLPMSANIVVTHPLPGTIVHENEMIEGFARAFEANVLYRLFDDNGVIVTEETFTTADYGAPSYSRFRDRIPFENSPTSAQGELQVYTRSAKDGSVQDLVRIRILF
ncbi:LysM peptidoglycan-binding domain-containing protein [Halalkalibacter kiskunsagensis]|uniref:LysM peptidoglycan-binding domain-containing protein n=1 Tax=Halalkalibacter kiskunsagensis TaxID=1548599 RepID=A0ABV6KBS4_9BACI